MKPAPQPNQIPDQGTAGPAAVPAPESARAPAAAPAPWHPSVQLSWEKNRPERGHLSVFVYHLVGNELLPKFEKSGGEKLCANYASLSEQDKVTVWSELIASTAMRMNRPKGGGMMGLTAEEKAKCMLDLPGPVGRGKKSSDPFLNVDCAARSMASKAEAGADFTRGVPLDRAAQGIHSFRFCKHHA